MAVCVTGPRAVNELGGPVIPGSTHCAYPELYRHCYHYIVKALLHAMMYPRFFQDVKVNDG